MLENAINRINIKAIENHVNRDENFLFDEDGVH